MTAIRTVLSRLARNIPWTVAFALACSLAYVMGYSHAHRELLERMDRFATREAQVERMARTVDNAIHRAKAGR